MKIICGIGEILLRYSNINNQQYLNGEAIRLNFGGAEYNVICNLSNWGHQCYFLSKLENNWLNHQAISNLKKYGGKIDFLVEDKSENARLGSYFLLNLHGSGISQVIYDRKNSSFCHLTTAEIDTQQLFNKVDTIYLSGIALAVDQKVRQVILKLVKSAKKAKKTVIFDFNYRAKLWDYQQAKQTYEEILPFCDIVSCSFKDLEKILKMTEKNDELSEDQNLTHAYQKLITKYPNLKLIFQAKREIISPSEQNYQGYLFNGQNLFKSSKYNIKNYLDRIGSGDAFASGLIHALINHESEQNAIEFATKAGAIKHYYQGDNNGLHLEYIKLFNQNNDVSR